MDRLTDSEIISRLIYRAYIQPDPTAPLEAEALLPFTAALDLYARTRAGEAPEWPPLRSTDEDWTSDVCSEPCPPGADKSETAAPDRQTDGAGNNNGKGVTPGAFVGKSKGEKQEIFARLNAFIATHGLGARRKIAETCNGAATLEEVQAMANTMPFPIAKWRVIAAAMDKIEEKEKGAD